MKILIVNDYSTPLGGVELRLLDLRRSLIARGHDVRVFSSGAAESFDSTDAEYLCYGTLGKFRTLLQTVNPSAYFSLKKALAEFAPDVVHVNMFLTQLSPLVLPALANFPTIYNAAWYRAICPTGTKMLPDGSSCHLSHGSVCASSGCISALDATLLSWQMKMLTRWRHNIDVIVSNSEAVRQRLEADNFGPSEVIHNGVPEASQRTTIADDPKVCFAGRLVNTKGVDVLLRAFAKVLPEYPRATLLIAGSGPQLPMLNKLIAELGITGSITMLGQVPRPELESKFADAWVQAVPSVWEEPFGLVAAEAMMRGMPVIASSSGGLGEIVRHGETGYLTAPGDENAIADALRQLFGNRELVHKLGQQARLVALENFSDQAYVNKFEELYQRMVAQKTGQALARQEVQCSR